MLAAFTPALATANEPDQGLLLLTAAHADDAVADQAAAAKSDAAKAGEASPATVASAAEPESQQALALKLANPVAALVSVPMQFNFDGDIGPARKGSRITLNVQPVIPFRISKDWLLISRTIVPIVWQKNIFPGSGSQFGLSDTIQSVFISPTKTGSFAWGAGPVLLIPTGTDALLSTRKWGAGPSAVVLKQNGPWTYGGLVNQVWSYAGNSSRADVNQMLINPFVSHASPTAFTMVVSADVTRDWNAKTWVVPISFSVSQVTRIGKQLAQVGGGVRYYVATSPASPHGFAARFSVTLLFPQRQSK